MRTRLLTFVGAGVAGAEVIGLVALALWLRDQYVVGFSSGALWRPILLLALIGGLIGLASHLITKPGRVR